VTSALLMLLVANVLIFVHELGHLLAAKWAGMPVTSFSVGFGPALLSTTRGETEYRLALVPLGGFVRIEGMRGTDEERARWPHGFAFQPLSLRLVVIVAGVLANVVLALVLYAAVSVTGRWTGPVEARLAVVDHGELPPVSGWSTVPTELRIVRLDGRAIDDWSGLAMALLGAKEGFHRLVFEDGTTHQVWVPAEEDARIRLLESLIPVPPSPRALGVADGAAAGAREVRRNAGLIAESGRLLATGAIGLRQLNGPIEIARVSERTFEMGIGQLLAFVAFLSLNLAILNFLPIPLLDGGHFAMLVLEGASGRPVPPRLRRYGDVAGATVVCFFMTFVFLNDLLRLFGL
jgi:regulator of sigma E protease